MSTGLPSDEVAEDYQTSLNDLTQNSRYEISNLTVIAKENTEHAMAISRVLENHIRNVSNHLDSPDIRHSTVQHGSLASSLRSEIIFYVVNADVFLDRS